MDPLEAAAREVAGRAYCPYSRYRVGAALETADGTVFSGCNVENAVYPLGVCAERSALSAAVSAGHREFRRIFVVAGTDRPGPPCGACRQMLSEFAPDLPIESTTLAEGGPRKAWRLSQLLPDWYGPQDLEGVDKDPDA